MSDRTGIQWTDATWNPIRGCTRVSEGCRNCYAEAVAARFSGPGLAYEGLARSTESGPRWTGEVRLIEKHLHDPIRWKEPRRIFVNSMSDLFHESLSDDVIDRVFAVMLQAPQHTYQILTKRPERMRKYFSPGHTTSRAAMAMWRLAGEPPRVPWPLPNVWLGVSVENQSTAAARIPELLGTPAHIRFISAEPLLGPLALRPSDDFSDRGHGRRWLGGPSMAAGKPRGLDWVICGGESGPHARPMHPAWARSMRDQCERAGVPFFMKQWGEWAPAYPGDGREPSESMPFQYLDDPPVKVWRFGKRQAGAVLDGEELRQFPQVTP